jgi:hypothetical protein
MAAFSARFSDPIVPHDKYAIRFYLVRDIMKFVEILGNRVCRSKAFGDLGCTMKRLVELYNREYDSLYDEREQVISQERLLGFRMQVSNALHKWNVFLVAHGLDDHAIPQLQLDPACECHMYGMHNILIRMDPMYISIKSMLSTITLDEARRRYELCESRRSGVFDIMEKQFFIKTLQIIMTRTMELERPDGDTSDVRRSSNREEVDNYIGALWYMPSRRWLFIRMFHYYLQMVKS